MPTRQEAEFLGFVFLNPGDLGQRVNPRHILPDNRAHFLFLAQVAVITVGQRIEADVFVSAVTEADRNHDRVRRRLIDIHPCDKRIQPDRQLADRLQDVVIEILDLFVTDEQLAALLQPFQ